MLHEIKPRRNRFKEAYVRALLFVFGRALQTVSRWDPMIRREIARWPENILILYKILPHGPRMAVLRNSRGRLEYQGSSAREEDAGLILSVKNLESAFLVMSLQLGTAQAYAEHRVAVSGNVMVAMSLIQCLNVLITYLAPERFAAKVVKRLPAIPVGRKLLYRFFILFIGIPFGL